MSGWREREGRTIEESLNWNEQALICGWVGRVKCKGREEVRACVHA